MNRGGISIRINNYSFFYPTGCYGSFLIRLYLVPLATTVLGTWVARATVICVAINLGAWLAFIPLVGLGEGGHVKHK